MKAKFAVAVLASVMSMVTLGQAAAQDKTILMSLWKGNTDAETAFKARLAELGIKASYTEIDAAQDRGKLATALRALQPDIAAKKFDLIYTYGTVGTQVAMAAVENGPPIIFNISFDPQGAKLVNSLQAPGGNLTGVTNGVPITDQFSAFMKLKPIKSLVVLFNAREPNSNSIEQQVKDWADKNNVTFVSRRVAPEGDALAQAIDEIKSGKLSADSLYAGADNYLASKATDIQTALGDKVNLFGGTQTYVSRGWLAAYTPAVKDMGIAAAEQAAKVLSGQSPANLPVILPTPKLFVSQSAAAKHGVTLPPEAVAEK